MSVDDDAASGAWQPPTPAGMSPEMETLRRFHFDCQWTGKVRSNGMGPGSPDMEAVGNASYRPIMDGAWLVGDFEQDQFVESVRVITWKAHFVLGWDPRVREYRAAYVDNNGSSALLRGYIDGPRFVMEIVGDGTVRNRMQWELLDDGRVSWRNDCSIDSGPWFLVEEYVCTPLRQTSDMT